MDRRILLAIIAIIVIGGVFYVARAQSAHHTARHLTFEFRVKGNTMTPSELSATQGDTVTIKVGSDSKFELHLHGYNRTLELAPNKTASVTFKADTSGSFEMENE